MVSAQGEDNENTTTIHLISKTLHMQHTFFLISKKNNFARAAHFFVHFFAVVLHD